MFFIIFSIPNFLIKQFKIREKNRILKDLLTLSYNLKLVLSVNISLYEALKFSCNNLKYKRIKSELVDFTERYKIYNYNIRIACNKLLYKFNNEEVSTLVNILSEGQSRENIINLLCMYKENVGFKVQKLIKRGYASEMYIILSLSILLLINTFLIIIYPMSTQIIDNLNIILN